MIVRITARQSRTQGARTALSARAFTLIEMLVVIAIIGILAGIILTVGPGVIGKRTRSVVQTELARLTTAIDTYQAERGFYPPSVDNGRYSSNSLFYELTGTQGDGNRFTNSLVLDNFLDTAQLNATFAVGGVINSGPTGGKNYLVGLRPQSYGPLKTPGNTNNWPHVLVVPAKGADESVPNVWYYDASSPDRRNKNSYDLWAEVKLGNKVLRIGNWKD